MQDASVWFLVCIEMPSIKVQDPDNVLCVKASILHVLCVQAPRGLVYQDHKQPVVGINLYLCLVRRLGWNARTLLSSIQRDKKVPAFKTHASSTKRKPECPRYQDCLYWGCSLLRIDQCEAGCTRVSAPSWGGWTVESSWIWKSQSSLEMMTHWL